jgi:hypothetical protein
MTLWTLSSKPYEPTAGGWSTGYALCGTSSRRGTPRLRKTSPQSPRKAREYAFAVQVATAESERELASA